jgi:hypothetical protein
MSLQNNTIDFGDTFVNFTVERTLTFNNDTDLPAQYELIQQDEVSQSTAIYSVEPSEGVVEADSSSTIKILFISKKLGPINLPVYFRIKGSDQPPLEVTLMANSSGPIVTLDAKKDKFNFGRIPVLSKVERKLKMTNESLIAAPFKVIIKNKKQNFWVDTEEGIIPPGQSVVLTVTAFLDDAISFSTKMLIEVQNGNYYTVNLSGQGEGATIVPSQQLDTLDFGSKTTNQLCSQKFTLENKGKRTQIITWTNEKTLKNRKIATTKEQEEQIFFKIIPEKVVLQPGASQDYEVLGFSPFPQRISEKMLCHGVIEKISSVIFETQVTCQFDNPLLKFENPLVFSWNYTSQQPNPIPQVR